MLVLHKDEVSGLHLLSECQYTADIPHIRTYTYTQLIYQEFLLAALVHLRASSLHGAAIIVLAPTYLPEHACLFLPMTSSSPNIQQHNMSFLLCRSSICLCMRCGSTVHLFSSSCLQSQGMPEPKVKIKAMYRANQNIDITVAAQELHAGDTVLRIPEHLIITLKGVFEDEVSKQKCMHHMFNVSYTCPAIPYSPRTLRMHNLKRHFCCSMPLTSRRCPRLSYCASLS